MKRHLTLSTTSRHARNQADMAEAVADLVRASAGDGGRSEFARGRPRLTLASARVWRHTLVLTGKLDSRSAPELEEEIECLCQEGVTLLTLDLSQLEAIDPTGVAVIALRSSVCKRRGHDFAVIPGSAVIHRALAEGGASDVLTPETRVARFPSPTEDAAFSDRSTAMVKNM